MSELASVVTVNIQADSTSLTREGFGTPLILTYHTRFNERWKRYSGLAEMVADEFTSEDSAYRAAKAIFDQDPTVENVVVGRLPADPTLKQRITVTSAVEGEHVKFTVIQPDTGDTFPVDYTILAGATTSSVATALASALSTATGLTATASSSHVDLVGDNGAMVWVYGGADLTNCYVQEVTSDGGYDDELTALELEPGLSFYYIITDSNSTANVNKVADWVLSRRKMYLVGIQSGGLLDGTDTVASTLATAGNDRVSFLYCRNPHQFPQAAWAAHGGTPTPGSFTFAFKTLKGISPMELSSTAKGYLETSNVNFYNTVATGVTVTRWGKVASGEYMDIIHGIDALTVRIQEDILILKTQVPKLGFSPRGLSLVESTLGAAIDAFVGKDGEPGLLLDGSVTIKMPKLSAISGADKQARELNNVKFSANLEGAIHKTTVAGTLAL